MKTAHRSRSFRIVVSAVIGATVTGGALVGCSETAPPAASGAGQQQLSAAPRMPANAPTGAGPTDPQPSATPAAGTPVSTKAPAQPEPPPVSPMPPIPPDARFTIFCCAVRGPNHVAGANEARNALIRKTGRSDWYVIHGREESNIYFGFYPPLDRVTSGPANADLRMVKELKDTAGRQPFEKSLFVSLDAPDPTSPPEWNLYEIDRALAPRDPKRAYWSLQIAAFRADPLRKEAAVDLVKALRKEGVEAYYYHGEFVSSVTVGRWPITAVKRENEKEFLADHAETGSDVERPIVVTPFAVSDEEKAKPINGQRAVSVAPKLEVLDESMRAMMARYPHHAVNYEAGVKRDTNGKEYLDPSFLVAIPRAKGNGYFDSVAAHARPEPTIVRPTARPSMVGPQNGAAAGPR